MLQQTRIETVISYYGRFLERFPSLSHLARASTQQVLKRWAGMGYYARARNLHAAAQTIMNDLGGKIPADKESLLALPGFGPYTAGAVASIAFNQKAAALDGNVKRVLNRLSAAADSAISFLGKKQLEVFLEGLIPEGHASDFNQALMDMGATVCLPIRPKCPSCPIRRFCSFPGGEKKTERRKERKRRQEIWAVALIENNGRFLIHRNDDRGLLAGLWQFPAAVISGKADLLSPQMESPAKELLRKYLRDDFGIKVKFRKALPLLTHEFTHIQATLFPYLFFLAPEQHIPEINPYPVARWVKLPGLSRYPVSRIMTKVAGLLPKNRH